MTDRRISTPLRASLAATALFALGGSLAPGHAEDVASAASAPSVAAEQPAVRFIASPVEMDTDALEQIAAERRAEEARIAALEEQGDLWEQYGSGSASYYASRFDGRRTASGERFDNDAYTAAHRSLPFGTKVRVTRGGKSVVVRINDRGPFAHSRVIDLSQAAARDIGLIGPGHGTVNLALLSE